MNWQSHAIDLLAASLVRPFALVAAAGLILRVFKVRHPASRHAVWMSVLIGMLLLPVVAVVAPRWKLPLLPLKQQAVIEPHAIPPVSPNLNYERRDFALNPVAPSDTTKFAWPEPRTLALWAYLVGLLAMVAYRVMGWAILRLMVARSTPVSARRVRESNDILTPVTVGVLRPLVLLPPEWRDWQPKVRRAVLAHEFAHIRRRDTLLLSLTRLAKCVYWFHPLAWWISRQVSNLAELSCDAIALEKFGDPAGYSRILLDFATTVDQAGYRLALPGLAMASGSGISRRVEQIFELAGGNLKRLSGPGILLVLAGVPVVCCTAVVGVRASAPVVSPPHPVFVAQTLPLALQHAQPAAAPVPSPTPPALKFEVASVRPTISLSEYLVQQSPDLRANNSNAFSRREAIRNIMAGLSLQVSGRRVTTDGMSMKALIAEAYRIDPRLVVGPGWVNEAEVRFTVQAVMPEGVTKEQMPDMLKALLEERFHVVTHRAASDYPVYALVTGKDGPKLKQPGDIDRSACNSWEDTPTGPDDTIGQICRDRGVNMMTNSGSGPFLRSVSGEELHEEFFRITMPMLARLLTQRLSTGGPYEPIPGDLIQVVDRTGIAGAWDLVLDTSDGSHTALSSYSASLERQGLRLERTATPIWKLIIDTVDRVPAEN